ncbi:hypothetical protein Taro_001706 [Colocasia esculenta]|uniref:Uncharacterized protein n=1 Tax=Colocasia esculenta TaxID=4460 RepID=A0A843TIQ3_COLES|nr:hypothetical protein [Colocasia esculenta]
MQQRVANLKKEVLEMLRNGNCHPSSKMSMIDAIERLGIAYHFEEEISEVLEQIYGAQLETKDLHMVALRFRLLRQEGHNISADNYVFIFTKKLFREKLFPSETVLHTTKRTLSSDVKGLLSLYEVGYLAKHGEAILDKAITFCKNHLKAKLNHVEPEVAMQIAHALEIPLYRRVKRLEAREYITIYERLEGRNDQLLELAKLDFNLVQALHQEEIKNISSRTFIFVHFSLSSGSTILRWWKELGLTTRLTFARDRLVECYLWILAIYFEPSLSQARVMGTKVLGLASLLDDIYDSFGTLEELEVFTEILRGWEAHPSEQLPECLNIYLITLINAVKELEEELAKDGHQYRAHFLRQEIAKAAMAYLEEAKWSNEGYVPPFEVHLGVILISALFQTITCGCFLGLGEIATSEAFDWLASFPKILKASTVIGRLMNDIASYEREKKQDHVASSIECYMKEYGTTFEDARGKLQEMIEDGWKDINRESLEPTKLPMPLLMPSLNLARASVTFYRSEFDGYTDSSQAIKDHITLLFTQSIPIN